MAKFGRTGNKNESFDKALDELKTALPGINHLDYVVEDVDLQTVERDPNQPRPIEEVMDGIEEFADELERDNFELAQLPVFHIEDDGRKTIVVGERRTTAFKLKHQKTIPALCKKFTEEERKKIFILQYVENDDKLKKTLSPIADARWWKRFIDEHHNGNASKAAEARGRSSTEVSNRLSLLNAPANIQDFVQVNRLRDPATFAALVRLNKVAGKSVVNSVVSDYENDLITGSLRQYVEKLAREAKKAKKAKEPSKSEPVKKVIVEEVNTVFEKSDSLPGENKTKQTTPPPSVFDDGEEKQTPETSGASDLIETALESIQSASFKAALLKTENTKNQESYKELLNLLTSAIGSLEEAYSTYNAERTLALPESVD